MPVKTPPKKQPNAKLQAEATPDQLRTKSAIAPLAQNRESLPNGWRWVKLGEVCKLKNGFAFKSTEYRTTGVPVIRISDINEGVVSSEGSVKVSPTQEYENYLVENDDILVAMSGATTGKFGIFKSKEKAYQNQRVGKFKILDEKILDNYFLFHQINALKRQIEKDAYGGAQPNISSTKIEQMEVLLPPISEQHTIVSKIEELLSELDKGKQQLETAQQQLKIYRQAVLKWAFEGKLAGDITKWKLTKLKDAASKIVVGYVGPVTEHIVSENGIKFLSTTHIGENEFLSHDIREVSKTFNEKNKKSQVIPGDLLIARHGDSGKACIVPDAIDIAQVSNAVILRPNPEIISSKFICYRINAERQRMQKMKVGGVFQVVNTKSMESFEVSIPPMNEQKLIIQEIESRLSVCDKVEETITTSLQQAETLRQSILKKAFEGKLVTINSAV